ncbi:MAG: hypothetical protein EHM33_04260 [Chloroflexi bacterium]|nr:MAG: hypothetical protein EHM33_04260 [Chloroflexota bacterium]
MKTKIIVSSILLLLAACTAPSTVVSSPTALHPTPSATVTPSSAATLTATTTSPAPTPAFTSALLPDGLVVAYIVNDELWVWKENHAQLLIQRQNIFDPLLSDDGQWLIFKQWHLGEVVSEEVWVMQTDGSKLHRLLGPNELRSLADEETLLLANDISWLPGRHELLFNTQELIAGPPGSRPIFDLYSLDLSGQITRLADPGQGGKVLFLTQWIICCHGDRFENRCSKFGKREATNPT